jgi:hypothetical protein
MLMAYFFDAICSWHIGTSHSNLAGNFRFVRPAFGTGNFHESDSKINLVGIHMTFSSEFCLPVYETSVSE